MTISDDFVSSKIYDRRDDFYFDIVMFPFLDGDIPPATSYGVYISQLIRLLECLVMLLTLTLGIKFYHRNFSNKTIGITNFVKPFFQNSTDATTTCYQNLIQDSNLFKKALSELEFYGDLVYKFRIFVV